MTACQDMRTSTASTPSRAHRSPHTPSPRAHTRSRATPAHARWRCNSSLAHPRLRHRPLCSHRATGSGRGDMTRSTLTHHLHGLLRRLMSVSYTHLTLPTSDLV